MPAITHAPEVLEFKKLSMLSADGDGEQWGPSYTAGECKFLQGPWKII